MSIVHNVRQQIKSMAENAKIKTSFLMKNFSIALFFQA